MFSDTGQQSMKNKSAVSNLFDSDWNFSPGEGEIEICKRDE